MAKHVVRNVALEWETADSLASRVLVGSPNRKAREAIVHALQGHTTKTMSGRMTSRVLLTDGNDQEVVLPLKMIVEASFDDTVS